MSGRQNIVSRNSFEKMGITINCQKKGGGGKVGLKIYLERSALAGTPTTWNQNERNCASFFILYMEKQEGKVS